MSDLLSEALNAAQAATALLRRDYLTDSQLTDSGGKDVKTRADVVAENMILSKLESTGIPILAEEGKHRHWDTSRPLWLVDPLDGTLNFSRGFAMSAVSIALWDHGEPVLGVVAEIHHGWVYAGVVGQGAWCDGQHMAVSTVDTIGQAVLATGFPSGRCYETDSLLSFVQSVQRYKKIRMLGSAALMLAQVAAGHFDAYQEDDIYLWDVAAGLALVRAAGGRYSMEPGSGPLKYRVLATNGRI